jgi:hypothetical protein
MKKTLLTLSILAALGTLTACGGGSSTSSNDPGAAPSKNVSGVITAVNRGAAKTLTGVASGTSITVNGVDYALETDTSIDVDDAAGIEDDLAEGQVVNMEVTDDGDGTYSVAAVEYDDETQGYVLDNRLADDGTGAYVGTLIVMGKTVQVNATTRYEAGDLETAPTINLLVANDIVEVSGYPDANGEIIATRIEGKGAGEDIEVKGVITAVDVVTSTFTMDGMTVDFGGAEVGDLPVDPAAWVGLYVEVKSGEDTGALVLNGDGVTYTFIADEVELQDGGDMKDESAEEGDEMELTGVLVVDAGAMSVGGQALLDPDSLVDVTLAGELVQVEGAIDADGNLVVSEFEIED